tara:strand:- start:186 stop:524 length:339 start_codon:yes stop_codon:yes gene_type:complete
MRRNPGVEVTSRTGTDPFGGSKFDAWGRAFGKQALAAGVLDEGVRQPQFGSTSMVKSVSVTKKGQVANRQTSSASPKAKDKRVNLLGGGGTRKEYTGGGNADTLERKTLLGA